MDEAALIVGRRGGKSMIAALVGVYLALVADWRPFLAPGETATVALIAQNTRAACRALFAYVRGIVFSIPALRREVTQERFDELVFGKRQVAIAVWPSTHRSVRGLTLAGAILDEVDHWWQGDSPNAAAEVVASVRPALVSLSGSKLIALSSPYTATGWLHGFHRAHFAKPGSYLCWKAPSLVMNPTLDVERVEAMKAEDVARGISEWDAEWRPGLAALLDAHLIEACARQSREPVYPRRGLGYVGAVDPSGGGSDEFAWAIGHGERESGGGTRVIVDVVDGRRGRGKEPLDLDAAVRDCAEVMHSFGISTLIGDRYAGSWVSQAFARHGISYRPSQISASDCYLGLLPLFTTRRIEIPDDIILIQQLQLLERRRGAQGKDAVTHPIGGHDDRANVVALAASAMTAVVRRFIPVGY